MIAFAWFMFKLGLLGLLFAALALVMASGEPYNDGMYPYASVVVSFLV